MKNVPEPSERLAEPTPIFRYQQLSEEIEHQILNGTYRVGDRLPSIRKLHRRLNLSISTVFKAYAALETIGLVEVRSKSGYYVAGEGLRQLAPPAFETRSPLPRKVSLTGMVTSILSAMSDPEMLPFGSSAISTDLLPYKAFSRILKNLSARELKAQFGYSLAEGDPGLRRQLAGRMVGWSQAPDEKKEQLVKFLNRRNIPLIEDEIYADLHYGPNRPIPLRAFDRKDLVITCGSLSKTLVPGLRIGWIVAGKRFLDKVKDLKAGMNVSTATLNQHIVATYLAGTSYDRHLRVLRRHLKNQTFNIAGAVQKYFPEGTRLSLPQGGALLWVQLAGSGQRLGSLSEGAGPWP